MRMFEMIVGFFDVFSFAISRHFSASHVIKFNGTRAVGNIFMRKSSKVIIRQNVHSSLLKCNSNPVIKCFFLRSLLRCRKWKLQLIKVEIHFGTLKRCPYNQDYLERFSLNGSSRGQTRHFFILSKVQLC